MSKIKNNFSKIINYKNQIDESFTQINDKLKFLMDLYINIVNNNNKIDTLTTDSFYFQNKLIKMLLENNRNIFKYINNQIYGDYYKLIKYIQKYIETTFESSDESGITTIVKKFLPYKISDNSNNHTIICSEKIYINIVDTINELIKYKEESDKLLNTTKTSLNNGINIENYLESIKFKNLLIQQNIDLFTAFLDRYIKYHEQYLNNLRVTLENLHKNIIDNIYFDTSTIKSSNIPKKALISNFISQDIKNEIIYTKSDIINNNNRIRFINSRTYLYLYVTPCFISIMSYIFYYNYSYFL